MSSAPPAGQDDFFPTTRWTLVVTAREGEGEAAATALNDLCRTYRRPLLVYLEKRLRSRHEAEDMVQEYFTSLLSRRYWAEADPGAGRFREFLMRDLNLFLKSRKRHNGVARRGGDAVHVPLDAVEQAGKEAPNDAPNDAELSFQHAWAVQVFSQALKRLSSDYVTPKQREVFDLLRPHLDRRGNAELYKRVAALTGKSEDAVARQFGQLKQRLRFHLKTLVRDTVNHPSEVPDELNHLFRSLCSIPQHIGDGVPD